MYDAERLPDYLYDLDHADRGPADPVLSDETNEVIEHDPTYRPSHTQLDTDERLNWRFQLKVVALAAALLLLIIVLFAIFGL